MEGIPGSRGSDVSDYTLLPLFLRQEGESGRGERRGKQGRSGPSRRLILVEDQEAAECVRICLTAESKTQHDRGRGERRKRRGSEGHEEEEGEGGDFEEFWGLWGSGVPPGSCWQSALEGPSKGPVPERPHPALCCGTP